jgi:hypothetical protein
MHLVVDVVPRTIRITGEVDSRRGDGGHKAGGAGRYIYCAVDIPVRALEIFLLHFLFVFLVQLQNALSSGL